MSLVVLRTAGTTTRKRTNIMATITVAASGRWHVGCRMDTWSSCARVCGFWYNFI